VAEWLAVYGLDIDNVRAALDWAFSPGGDVTIGVALTVASERLWFGLSLMDECCRRVERALASLHSGVQGSTRLEMHLNATLAATLFNTKGPGSEAGAAWRDVLETAEQLDDTEYRLRALWGLWYIISVTESAEPRARFRAKFYTVPPNQAGPADLLIGERMLGTSPVLPGRS
jgi:hypothetical protein